MHARAKFFVGAVLLCVSACFWFLSGSGSDAEPPSFGSSPGGHLNPTIESGTISHVEIVKSEQKPKYDLIGLHAAAKARSRRLLDSGTLNLSDEAIAAIGLTPFEVTQINRALGSFVDSLLSEELSKAFVQVTAVGEEIRVPPLNRRALNDQLEAELSKSIDSVLARFVVESLAYDTELGAVDTDLVIAIETDDQGVDRLAFTRRVLRPKAYDTKIPIMQPDFVNPQTGKRVQRTISSTLIVKTQRLLNSSPPRRIARLLGAVDKLPVKK